MYANQIKSAIGVFEINIMHGQITIQCDAQHLPQLKFG